MGSLTNLGEFVCLYKGLGGDSSAAGTAYALSYANRNTAGINIELARLVNTSDSPENPENWECGDSTTELGYTSQLGLFAQPAYGANDTSTCFATNTNAVTFGPAQSDWGTWTHLALVVPASTGKDVVAYFELAQPVTITTGESYLVASNSLRLTFQPNTLNTSFNIATKRILLDQFLGIQDADSAQRAALQGIFPSSNDTNSSAVFITVTDTPPTDVDIQNIELGTIEAASIQPITFSFTNFDTRPEMSARPAGEIRVSNTARITFTFPPDQVNSTNRTVTHFVIVNSNFYTLAVVPLATPRTFGPLNNLTIDPAGFSMAFN